METPIFDQIPKKYQIALEGLSIEGTAEQLQMLSRLLQYPDADDYEDEDIDEDRDEDEDGGYDEERFQKDLCFVENLQNEIKLTLEIDTPDTPDGA